MNNHLVMTSESNLMLAAGKGHHPQAYCFMERRQPSIACTLYPPSRSILEAGSRQELSGFVVDLHSA